MFQKRETMLVNYYMETKGTCATRRTFFNQFFLHHLHCNFNILHNIANHYVYQQNIKNDTKLTIIPTDTFRYLQNI